VLASASLTTLRSSNSSAQSRLTDSSSDIKNANVIGLPPRGATRCGRSRWSNRPALSYTSTLMKLMATRDKAEIIGRMKILFDSRGINAANSARHGGGHRHGHSRALLRRDRGDDLLCFDQRRIFGLRLVPSGSRLEKADCRRAAVASMPHLGVGLAT
jgi:hypothetical protein